VHVIVPVFNKRRFLETTLCSVLDAAESSGLARVTVMDHGSTDGSLELGASLCRGRAHHVVRPGGTVAALRNAGARDSDCPILCFLDSDCVVPPGYFEALCQVMSNPEVAATGRRVDYPADGAWIERTWHSMHSSTSNGFRKYLNSGNFAIRREVFESIGGFNEAMITGEDSELGQRLNARGFRIWESGDLAVLHLDNPQSISGFFKKEVWHGQGMLGTLRAWPPHLPVIGTVLHVLLLLAAAVWLFLGPGGLGWRLVVAVGFAFIIPGLAVVYRAYSKRRRLAWVQAAVLYQTYWLAKIAALAMIFKRFRSGRKVSGQHPARPGDVSPDSAPPDIDLGTVRAARAPRIPAHGLTTPMPSDAPPARPSPE